MTPSSPRALVVTPPAFPRALLHGVLHPGLACTDAAYGVSVKRDRHAAPVLADGVTASASPTRVAGRPRYERMYALNGRPRGTVGRGAGCRYGGWISTRSSLRSRAVASVGYRAEHAALARYLALVVNELITAGALPPNGRATELGS
jgi:hypothetical protein